MSSEFSLKVNLEWIHFIFIFLPHAHPDEDRFLLHNMAFDEYNIKLIKGVNIFSMSLSLDSAQYPGDLTIISSFALFHFSPQLCAGREASLHLSCSYNPPLLHPLPPRLPPFSTLSPQLKTHTHTPRLSADQSVGSDQTCTLNYNPYEWISDFIISMCALEVEGKSIFMWPWVRGCEEWCEEMQRRI